jgi:hypothetical protein
MVVLKRSEFNRTKANNNKAKHKQNSKKRRIKGDAQNVHHSFRDTVVHAVVNLI